MSYHRPACVKCGVTMKCARTGVDSLELKEDGTPYLLWEADLYQCPTCGSQILWGFGVGPLRRLSDDGFLHHVSRLRAEGGLIEFK